MPQRTAVTVSEAAPAKRNVTLARDRSTIAALWVRGTPNAANVFVDGRAVGRAPLWLDALAPGRHRVDVSAPGREPWQAVVPAEAGTTTRIDVELADPEAAAWPGYRFVGYGVAGGLLVAGGVVGLVAVDAKKDFDATPSSSGKERVEDLNLAADVLFVSGAVVGLGTLVWDLLREAPPRSRGRVTVTR